MTEGFAPSEFWRQTPRTFIAVMEGRARAAEREFELALSQAWHGEAFARQKKLKDLVRYLPKRKDEGPVAPELVLDAMLTLQAAGVAMDVRKLN